MAKKLSYSVGFVDKIARTFGEEHVLTKSTKDNSVFVGRILKGMQSVPGKISVTANNLYQEWDAKYRSATLLEINSSIEAKKDKKLSVSENRELKNLMDLKRFYEEE